MAPLLDLRDLTVELPTRGGWVRPVNGVSLRMEQGGSLGLVGESGSGKTMLSLALMGLLPLGARVSGKAEFSAGDGGAIDLANTSAKDWIALRGRRIAMIFQEPMTALNPVMRVGEQVAEALRAHNPHLHGEALDRAVREALVRAAVPEPELRARQYPHELSGGLRQRVLIAMALAADSAENIGGARLLIADEPTTALDVTVQKQILELLARLRRELGLTLLFITHDLGVVAQVADRVAVLYAGRIVEEGPTQEVLRAPRHPYTSGLLRASPQLVRRTLEVIPGAVPALDELPPGCAFAPRCGLRVDACEAAVPELRDTRPEHRARCIFA
ncbi:MAG TPA: ABC transporter ATP-binding protein [Candidatus Acidoferrales bacterium]|nr:ABC transporter ATP-binding protein [Candidatus Acidoferrales bacterium]